MVTSSVIPRILSIPHISISGEFVCIYLPFIFGPVQLFRSVVTNHHGRRSEQTLTEHGLGAVPKRSEALLALVGTTLVML